MLESVVGLSVIAEELEAAGEETRQGRGDTTAVSQAKSVDTGDETRRSSWHSRCVARENAVCPRRDALNSISSSQYTHATAGAMP